MIPSTTAWQTVGASVRGASHVRLGLPNQDAIHWLEHPCGAPGTGLVVMAVADGHGSAKCFRSHIGARLAVMTAVRIVQEELTDAESDLGDLAMIARLTRRIARGWVAAVERDLWLFPFEAEEFSRMLEREGQGAGRTVANRRPLAYGTTLCLVALTARFALYLQVGDGDIVTVSGDGRVTRPLPPDTRLFAGETTSLCTEDAAASFRVGFHASVSPEESSDLPALVLVSTDGYANSFKDDAGFLQVGPDVLSLIRDEGLAAVEASLGGWLEEASRAGSGDDVTLGLIFRPAAVHVQRRESSPTAVPRELLLV
jgi:hypothetical protein